MNRMNALLEGLRSELREADLSVKDRALSMKDRQFIFKAVAFGDYSPPFRVETWGISPKSGYVIKDHNGLTIKGSKGWEVKFSGDKAAKLFVKQMDKAVKESRELSEDASADEIQKAYALIKRYTFMAPFEVVASPGISKRRYHVYDAQGNRVTFTTSPSNWLYFNDKKDAEKFVKRANAIAKLRK